MIRSCFALSSHWSERSRRNVCKRPISWSTATPTKSRPGRPRASSRAPSAWLTAEIEYGHGGTHLSECVSSALATQLLLCPTAEVERVGIAAIDITGVINRNGLEPVDLHRFKNEGRDLAILHAADPDARLVGRIGLVGRVVGHIEDVLLVDEQAAGAAELLPLQQIFSILVKDLDAIVRAVGDK